MYPLLEQNKIGPKISNKEIRVIPKKLQNSIKLL